MRRPRSLAAPIMLLAALAMVLAACGDGDSGADPTPAGIGDEDTNATVPRDDDGAIGEPDDEDSQTDTTDVDSSGDDVVPNDDSGSDLPDLEGSDDDVVPTSNRARVVGSIGDEEIDLLLDEDTACAIEEPVGAGGEAVAEVHGKTSQGAEFALDWSVDDGELDLRLERDGDVWTVDQDLDGVDPPVIELTRNGEVLIDTAFDTESGGSVDAVLYVNCQPVAG